jgi:Dak2 domain-containing protein
VTSWTEVLQGVRGAIAEARDELSRLDAAAGDGDLGLTMTAAAEGAAALAERGGLDGKTTAEALRALGMELARVAPSTSGTLFARGLLQASRTAAAAAGAGTGASSTGGSSAGASAAPAAGAAAPGTAAQGDAAGDAAEASPGAGAPAPGDVAEASPGAGAAAPLDTAGNAATASPVAQAAALVQAAIEGIQKAGKAQPGDRTMLDALVPAAQALQEAAVRGDSPKAAAEAATRAARDGAEATKDLEPKIGRASWIAERARGNVDAGARAIAVIAAAIAATIT